MAVSVQDVPILAFDKIPGCISQGDPCKIPLEAFSEWMPYCRALDQRRCQNWLMWLHRLEREMSLLWLWSGKKSVLENSQAFEEGSRLYKGLAETTQKHKPASCSGQCLANWIFCQDWSRLMSPKKYFNTFLHLTKIDTFDFYPSTSEQWILDFQPFVAFVAFCR